MHDITNEALRKLYLACIRNSGFPVKMPVRTGSNDNDVLIHAVLQGLGLITASAEDLFSHDGEDVDQDSECTVSEMHHRSKSASCDSTASLISSLDFHTIAPAACRTTFSKPFDGHHSFELTNLEDRSATDKQ
jgi:hypothetical protein